MYQYNLTYEEIDAGVTNDELEQEREDYFNAIDNKADRDYDDCRLGD